MTHPELTSAEAVEVAAFCWPDVKWEAIGDPHGAFAVEWIPETENWRNSFDIEDWSNLHLAAAVLVERGHGDDLDDNMAWEWQQQHPKNPPRYDIWILSAPASAWAAAILATVREVGK